MTSFFITRELLNITFASAVVDMIFFQSLRMYELVNINLQHFYFVKETTLNSSFVIVIVEKCKIRANGYEYVELDKSN